MCGLAGIILKDTNRSDETYKKAGEVVSSLLKAAAIRGRHATGVAMVEKNGGQMIRKAPLSADYFTKTPIFTEAIETMDNSTGAVLGHTRFATQGSPKVNRNNHPIKAGSVVGTHNGWVSNDDELFDKFDLERFAEVDSEVLFRMYDKASNLGEFKEKMLSKVQGAVSMVWADSEFPNYIYIFKGNNPLEMVYLKEYRMFAYASTKEILIKGLVESVPNATMSWYKMDDWTMLRVDVKNFKIKKYNAQINLGARKTTTSRGITRYGAPATRLQGTGVVKHNSHRDMCESFQKASDGSQIRLFNHKNNNKRSK